MVFVIGHRGAKAYEPENTLRSLARALTFGVDAVEVDVRACKDGALVVIHDETVDRTTNGKGKVKDLTLNQLKRLDAGMGEKIPLLSEVLDFVKGKSMLLIEIKEKGIEDRVVKEVIDRDMLGDVVFISFYHTSIAKVKDLAPKSKTGIIFTCEPVDPADLAVKAKAEVLLPSYMTLTEHVVKKAHEKGLMVYTWVLNKPEEIIAALELGVDGFASDKPDLAVEYAKKQRTLLTW
ncbi:MAG: glycerophosphodiester phosphodiesterase [Candidatus Methanomethylicota archaeon]|uniref:Glycerophosphodiester phosphodiesterase n=1 Tax=Thermoproteota archaeon TaxID=2056631 RepID=A0A497EV93_9CREN|nr:MAG: glycerophosphodiester phosphodiesterase [Candidatus Verstraetearchaeota archaeon]